MSKVLIVIITKDYVAPECLESVLRQTVPCPWIISGRHPQHDDENYIYRLYKNCSANREAARKMALASDADYFLFVDSDIVLPETAVEEFLKQARPDNRILGGWYQILADGRWVAGRWVADNTFINFRDVAPSLTRTDLVGMGCAFVPRAAAEKIPFEDGTDLESRNEFGQAVLVGECGAYGNRAAEHNIPLYMVGEIVCKHLERNKNVTNQHLAA